MLAATITRLISNLRMKSSASPDFDTLGRRSVHAITRLHGKGIVEGVDIARRAIHTKLARTVRIGDQPLEQLGVAILAAPDLRPPEEDPLLAGEAVDLGRGFAVERYLVRLVGHGHAG